MHPPNPWTVFSPYCFLRTSLNIVITLLLQKGKHINFCIDILNYRILIGSFNFRITLLFYPNQKNETRYVQNQT